MGELTTFDGKRIVYLDEGDGPLVLALHGFICNANVDLVRPGIVDALTDAGYRVVAPDQRGHGRSDTPHDAADYHEGTALTLDAQALLDHLGVERCAVVGYSMGARVALHLASLDPRVAAAVTIGIGGNSLEPQAAGRDRIVQALLVEDRGTIEHPGVLRFRRMADAIRADRVALSTLMAVGQPELVDIIDLVHVPLLVCAGTDDSHAGDASLLAARVPGAQLCTVPGDHSSANSQPALHAAIVEFVQAQLPA